MNKVAFITGASRGIGREAALAFARAGFDLAISARTLNEGEQHEHALRDAAGAPLAGSLNGTAQTLRELGCRVLVVPMDLLDSDSALHACQAVLAEYGRIDVLINNAIYQGSDLNAGFMDLTRAVAEHMVTRGGGVVINVTSGAGESDPPVAAGKGGWGYAYGAGKAAVSRLSGVLSTELGEAGVRAYTLNPGVVTTESLKATIGDKGLIALRAGSAPPHVPAAVMLWLATDEQAPGFQRRTIAAQPFALEHGIVADWR
jgi:NAD(P)-dependent dehydrogenase (short-subunit alcohol dehydrogenase family)